MAVQALQRLETIQQEPTHPIRSTADGPSEFTFLAVLVLIILTLLVFVVGSLIRMKPATLNLSSTGVGVLTSLPRGGQ